MDEEFVKKRIQDDRFIVGMKWSLVPVRHDILRNEYWIYNLKFSLTEFQNGVKYVFFKFAVLPSEDEEKTLEWKTLDLLNNIKYSSKYSFATAVQNLYSAILRNVLDYELLSTLSNRYGNDLSKNIVRNVLVRGDRVLYKENTYYFQPNGNSCYLYQNLEDVGDRTKALYSPKKELVTKLEGLK
jgi:hypothetical protein